MTKRIETLVEDIFHVLETRGGWDAAVTDFLATETGAVFKSRLEDEEVERTGALRMSGMGRPCERQLWYKHNLPNGGESLPATTRLKFLYGDMVELLVLSLSIAAGHDVRGMQDSLNIAGISGHRDAVIDGVTVDVKSASPFSFQKFKSGLDPSDDGFGYLKQLEAYVAAGAAADPTVDGTRGAFLAVDKVSGAIALDIHTFDTSVEKLEREYERKKAMVDQAAPPARAFGTIPDGYKSKTKGFVKNGNEYLDFQCAYCEYKKECWPNMRTFLFKSGSGFKPKHFVKIVKEPNVPEAT